MFFLLRTRDGASSLRKQTFFVWLVTEAYPLRQSIHFRVIVSLYPLVELLWEDISGVINPC